MEINKEDLILNIEGFLRSEAIETDEKIFFFKNGDEREISQTRFTKLINKLNDLEFRNTYLFNSNYFEQIVSIPNTRVPSSFYFRRFRDGIFKEDTINEFKYELSNPSIEYVLALIYQYEHREIRQYRVMRPLSSKTKDDETFEDAIINLFRLNTLKIKSENNISCNRFCELSSSFLFHINYNLDIPFVGARYIENKRLRRSFRQGPSEFDTPRVIYNPELIYYYQQALSTDNALLEFLSFYHILENFYSIISEKDAINKVKMHLISPGFSYKDNKSIKDLIKVARKTEINSTDKIALSLVLEEFLDIDQLKTDLNDYDDIYYDYLLSTEVEFAGANPLSEERFIKTLSERLYNIRNALVHRKDGEKPKYTPFSKDEEDLRKEIPLIRFISEQIIIKTSKDL